MRFTAVLSHPKGRRRATYFRPSDPATDAGQTLAHGVSPFPSPRVGEEVARTKATPLGGDGRSASLFLLFVVFLIVTFPVTWLLMLFLGNLHTGLSYWGTLPLGILVSLLLAGSTSRVYSL